MSLVAVEPEAGRQRPAQASEGGESLGPAAIALDIEGPLARHANVDMIAVLQG